MESSKKDEESNEIDKLGKEELVRLLRKYRHMDSARKDYAIESGSTVSLQKRYIQLMEAEKENLLTDLSNVLTEKNHRADNETVQWILQILESFSLYKASIDEQLLLIGEMDEQVKKITKRVIRQKLKVQALFGSSMTIIEAQKHMSILEDRLYRVTTWFDSRVSRNERIRVRISEKLLDRTSFHQKYKGVKRRIAFMKRRMGELVDAAALTYDQREEYMSKMKTLREKNDRESRQHMLEMKEYHRLLHNDEKSRLFMFTKTKIRPLIEEDYIRLTRIQKAKENHYDEILRSYKKSFREILFIAETHDIHTLVFKYLTQEQKNFTRFQHLSNLNHELELIHKQILELKSMIDVKADEDRETKLAQKQKLTLYETNFKNGVMKLVQKRKECEKTKATLSQLLSIVQECFLLSNCEKSTLTRLLGSGGERVTEENVGLSLKSIELRLGEIQDEDEVLKIQKSVEVDHEPLPHLPKSALHQPNIARKHMGGPFRPKPTITTNLDPNGEEEEGEMSSLVSSSPLTYEELKKEMLKRVESSAILAITNSDTNYATYNED